MKTYGSTAARRWRNLCKTAGTVLGIAGLLSGCGTDTASSGTLGLSGTFSDITTSLSLRALSDHFTQSFKAVANGSLLSFSGYTVECATLTSPPTVYSAAVNADGTFNITLPSATALRCTLNSSSAVVATMVFTTSGSSMNGNTKTVDSVSLSGSASVGTVDVDTAEGSATVKSATLGMDLGSAEPWDMTGTWTITSLGTSLPTGYSDVCASGSKECRGPSANEKVYLRRITGVEFTPNSVCEANLSTAKSNNTAITSCPGTTGTAARYALEVWASSKTKDACKDRLGFSYADAKAFAKVDFTDSGVTEGPPVWSSSYTDKNSTVHTITGGWKSSEAKTSYEIANCQPVTKGGKSAYKCVDTVNGTYQISIGGGCVYQSDNTPANIKDWSQMKYDQAPKACEQTNLTGDLAGMRKDVCYPKYDSKQLVCTFTGGVYKTSDNSSTTQDKYDWNSSKIAASGARCSTLNAYPLAQAQCYAQYYQENLRSQGGSANADYCFREIQTDWTATSVANFIKDNGPARAQGRHMLSLLDFLPGGVATARGEEDSYRGVQVSDGTNNSWANCRVKEVFTLTPLKVTDSELLVVFVSESRNVTQTNVCLGASLDSTFRSIFKMTRN